MSFYDYILQLKLTAVGLHIVFSSNSCATPLNDIYVCWRDRRILLMRYFIWRSFISP